MRKLNKILTEKLKINKDFKPCLFQTIQPKQEGTCLAVYIPLTRNDRKSNIQLATYDYSMSQGYLSTEAVGRINKKNTKSYYTENWNDSWLTVLLFKEDAICFLTILLENNKEYIDVLEFVNKHSHDFDVLQKHTYQCAGPDDKYYDYSELKFLLSKIR